MLKAAASALAFTLAPIAAQESVRDLDLPGEHHKHLTTDTVDLWKLTVTADEVIRVDVSSSQFDPVIDFVRFGTDDRVEEIVVPEVDDPGSESHLLARVRSDGRYAIRVHGPGQRGGGNYRLYVERFVSRPIAAAGETAGNLDEAGMAHVRFAASRDETVVPHGAGVVELVDPMGFSLPDWQGCYDVERDGEHYVRVRGAPGAAFRVSVERARRRGLTSPSDRRESVSPHGLDEWVFAASEHEFRTLDVAGSWLAVRIVPRASDDQVDGSSAIRWLPVHSKGSSNRLAFVAARDGEFRLQIRSFAPRSNDYRLSFGDSSEPIDAGTPTVRRLRIGDARFFSFESRPGQVLRLDVTSDAFDPIVRLTDAAGVPMGENDDGGIDLGCRHEWLVTRGGLVRAQVASFGDGGGGDFQILWTDVPVPELPVGAARRGTTGPGATEHWHFDGKRDRTVFFAARSGTVDTAIALFDPTGVQIGFDDDSGADRGALLAIRLPRDGRYTVAITARSGQGEYTVQAIDPDAAR